MNILKLIFYPNVIPKIKDRISDSNMNNNIKRALVSDTGLLSIHFWAPTFKWSISIANIVDINRSPDLLSFPQQLAIFLTGVLFARFAYKIKPRNMNLLTINLFMSMTAMYQIGRIAIYKYDQTEKSKDENNSTPVTTEKLSLLRK
ncbi:mitochondrial pyruvate carrier protein 2, putative [Hepatocystis sp. ex Piliocolobus tephrosceles]|nr:mitochondrial pyruvate carrier protein 2, putative [Hepatocystis sp. ex Piliocolobus tephrosceles]